MRIFSEGWSNDKDGPGQRLILYLKGCNLHCPWCANPESIAPEKEILFHPERAKGDFSYVCPLKAIEGNHLNRELCKACKAIDCVEKWHHLAFERAGQEVSPQWILEKALAAKAFFGKTGGVTFGGGEPTLQADEVLETTHLLKEHGIHTAIESNASTPTYKEVAKEVDYVISDLKSATPAKLQAIAGGNGNLILENLEWASKNLSILLIRIPIISGFNDSEEERDSLRKFLVGLHKRGGLFKVELLRLHHLGAPKWRALGRLYPMEGVIEPSSELVERFSDSLKANGITTITT